MIKLNNMGEVKSDVGLVLFICVVMIFVLLVLLGCFGCLLVVG